MFKATGRTRLAVLTTIALAALLAACTPGALQPTEAPNGALAGASPAAGQVALVAELQAVDAQTVRVGGATLQIDSATQMETGLKVSQVVRAVAAAGDDGLTAVGITSDTGVADVDSFEVIGLVESQSADEWVISGQAVAVTTGTEIKGAPVVGSRVKAEGRIEAEGRWVAREIERRDAAAGTPGTPGATPATGNEFEFFGVVTAIDDETWTIGDRTVRVTAQTEVKAGAGLNVHVKVHALPQADGSLLAREIEPEAAAAGTQTPPGGDETEFTGVLSAISGDLWTIGATVVRVTAATEIKDAIQAGDLVKVHASLGADGVLAAREMELADGDDGDDNGGDDDNSGPGNDDDGDDDNSGPANDDDDNSGHGGDDDGGDDNGGHGRDD